jgi:DNA-binding NtrC family response regulator
MGTIRILVIDDEQVICDGCKMVLTDKAYSVDSRMSGAMGLHALQENTYDLLLLDMKLPDMDGMEILKTARTEYPATYVIVMTGYSTIKNAVDAMKLGAFDYLAKPFSDDELVMSVDRVLENKKLVEENRSLRKQLHDRYDFTNIIGENPRIFEIFERIKKVAPTDSTVLLEGESGTGKELFARAIHTHSHRASRQFIAVDCSTFSSTLLESELFGHVKGAFTGAIKDKPGIFEIAEGGTLFLDEVANLTMEIQGKLLRVMESQEYKPVGGNYSKKADARIVTATNRNLKSMVEDGTFREDLYYRLNVFPIFLPALRERKDDIPRLVYHFLRMFCKEAGKRIEGFTDDALEILVNYEWPGNVRQLKNVIERLIIMADSRVLDVAYLADQLQMKRSRSEDVVPKTLEELKAVKKHLLQNRYGEIERAFLLKALKACSGNVTQSAARVGMQRPNFHALMKKHRLTAKSVQA